MLYISRVRLTNIRCFDSLDIRLREPGRSVGWTALVGDNATGKSTLLRSIAMGLCDEASAAGLLKESDEGYIRRGKDTAVIDIELFEPRYPKRVFRITTRVLRRWRRRRMFSDIVRQTTIPKSETFPWEQIFVSGYGAGRGVAGTGDISAYSAIDAVYNLFNYSEGLQNPELTIRRLSERSDLLQREIFHSLSTFADTKEIHLTSRGIVVDGAWGKRMPLRDLADGHRSSFLWLTDLIGWALAYKPDIRGLHGIRGIVLIDELEQHLHARWSRRAVDDLRQLLPNVQFVIATHSPLIGSSVGLQLDEKRQDNLFVLEATDGNRVEAIPHEFMTGWRIDQVLASRAFRYQIHADPATRRTLKIGSELAGKQKRTRKEEIIYRRIKELLRDRFFTSESPIEREAESEAKERLHSEIEQLEKELFGEEPK